MKTYDHMGILLFFFLVGTVFLDVFDYLILWYSATEEGLETWHLLTGRYGPLFLLNMGGLFIATGMVAFKKGRTPGRLLIVTALTVIGIGAYRINLISIGQLVPLYPDLGEIQYIPTLPEIATFIGLVALVMLIYAVLTKILPMEEAAHISGE